MVNGKQVVETKSVKRESVIGSMPKPIKEETIAIPSISNEERELLARCVMAEAGNQGEYGMKLVCDCILNLVDDERCPNTITGVITKKGMFETWINGMIENITPSEEAYKVVDSEIKNRTNKEIKYFRTKHYHNFGSPCFSYKAHYFSK